MPSQAKKYLSLSAILLFVLPRPGLPSAQAVPLWNHAQWVAGRSMLTYHMSHLLHDFEGVSHDAKGEGLCQTGFCDFLIAVPVKSFDSGDSGRDAQMFEAARGAQFPLIVIRAHFPRAEAGFEWIHAGLEVQFAGQTAYYPRVSFRRVEQGGEFRITGTIPLTCSDFKIDRPSFLAIPIHNEIPVRVDMSWHVR